MCIPTDLTYKDAVDACELALTNLPRMVEHLPAELACAELLCTTLEEDEQLAEKLYHHLSKEEWPELAPREELILALRLVYARGFFERNLAREKDAHFNCVELALAIVDIAFDHWRIQGMQWVMGISGARDAIEHPGHSRPNISTPTRDHILKYISTL